MMTTPSYDRSTTHVDRDEIRDLVSAFRRRRLQRLWTHAYDSVGSAETTNFRSYKVLWMTPALPPTPVAVLRPPVDAEMQQSLEVQEILLRELDEMATRKAAGEAQLQALRVALISKMRTSPARPTWTTCPLAADYYWEAQS